MCVYSRLIESFEKKTMFMPSDNSQSSSRRTRPNESQTKWDYVKTFYYDPVKW
jgi:hypothetical protein